MESKAKIKRYQETQFSPTPIDRHKLNHNILDIALQTLVSALYNECAGEDGVSLSRCSRVTEIVRGRHGEMLRMCLSYLDDRRQELGSSWFFVRVGGCKSIPRIF